MQDVLVHEVVSGNQVKKILTFRSPVRPPCTINGDLACQDTVRGTLENVTESVSCGNYDHNEVRDLQYSMDGRRLIPVEASEAGAP